MTGTANGGRSDLSGLITATEKGGTFSAVIGSQFSAAGRVVMNPDGSVSLRAAAPAPSTATGAVPVAPKGVTIEGGVVVMNPGNTVIHTDRIVTPANAPAQALTSPPVVSAAPTSIPLRTPSGGSVVTGSAIVASPTGLPVNPAPTQSVINWGGLSITGASSVNVSQPSGGTPTLNIVGTGSSISINGNLTFSGAVNIVNPGGDDYGHRPGQSHCGIQH